MLGYEQQETDFGMRTWFAAAFVALAFPAGAADLSDCKLPIYTAEHMGKTFRLTFDEKSDATLWGDGLVPIVFDMWTQNGTGRRFLTEKPSGKRGLQTEIIGLTDSAVAHTGKGAPAVLVLPDLRPQWLYDDRAGETNVYLPSGTWRLTGCVAP